MKLTLETKRLVGVACTASYACSALAGTTGTQHHVWSALSDAIPLWYAPAYQPIKVVTKQEIRSRWKAVMPGTILEPISVDSIEVFRLSYDSTDAHGKMARVSGMVALPSEGAPKGLVLYYHCTTSLRDNVPSRYRGDAEPIIFAFASAGYAVAAPDYLGHGDHSGIQPYALGSITARSGIDMIEPARNLAQIAGNPIGTNLFVTGYSEGGAAAMWATRLLQESKNPLHRVTRSAPMSGPYDLSDTQAKWMLRKHSCAAWLGSVAYLAAYASYGMQENGMGVSLKELFVRDFATYVPHIFRSNLNDFERARQLTVKGAHYRDFDRLGVILKPDFLAALQTRDVKHPFVRQLAKQDCYEWKPESPMWLYCVEDDFIVSRKSTRRAIQEMRQLGVGKDTVRMYVEKGRRYCHLKGQFPALLAARAFFDGGFDAVPNTCEFSGKEYKAKTAP